MFLNIAIELLHFDVHFVVSFVKTLLWSFIEFSDLITFLCTSPHSEGSHYMYFIPMDICS